MWLLVIVAAVAGANGGCPPANQCGINETYAKCGVQYPFNYCPENDSRAVIAIEPLPNCDPGCVCKQNHKRTSREDDTCILSRECPPVDCTRPNEEWNPCSIRYLDESCDNYNKRTNEHSEENCEPQCVCSKGYCRNEDDICVLGPDTCGLNEKMVKCRTICPPQSCEISYTSYLCAEDLPCEPGCDCIENYLRNSSGICILNDECPPPPTAEGPETQECPEDETPHKPQKTSKKSSSKSKSHSSSSSSSSSSFSASSSSSSSNWNEDNDCPTEKPPIKCGPNEKRARCKIVCPPQTCESPYTDYACESPTPCIEGCNCIENYLRDSNGVCVPSNECPPPQGQCAVNESYVSCAFGCPNNYCPENDNLGTIVCDPPRNCPPGCMCIFNYRRRSYDDSTCILAEECPPVTCTRPNEEWSPCPNPCLVEYCESYSNDPSTCNTFVRNCEPRCVCSDGFCRDDNSICVPLPNK